MRRTVLFSFYLTLFFLAKSATATIPTPLFFQDGPNAPQLLEPPAWNFDFPRGVSRTEGVAPLSVVFSAGLSGSSPTERSFHDYEYQWDFDDPSSGSWATSGKSKNSDKGPVASHLYELPGTYTATLTVLNKDGVVDTETFTITVNDPDIVFSGTNTTCISASEQNDFTGCPAGANQITTDDLSDLRAYTGAGKRLLLHRGSQWTVTAGPLYTNGETCTIAAYGACNSPDTQGICSNAPIINVTGDMMFLGLSSKLDWRLLDITFSNPDKLANVIGGAIRIRDFLALRVKTTGFDLPIEISHWRNKDSDVIENNSFISCHISEAGSTGVYLGSEQLAFMGNIVEYIDLSHVARVWQAYIGVINHNYISGSSVVSGTGRHALKLHGIEESLLGDFASTGGSGLRNRTEFVVVANNVFGSSGPWPVAIGPQNTVKDERLLDIIFEKNRIVDDFGAQNKVPVTVPLSVSARHVSVRNNIITGSSDIDGFLGMHIYKKGIEPNPTGISVYNNTIYSRGDLKYYGRGIQIGETVTNTVIANNLVTFKDNTNKTLIQDDSGTAVAESNFMSDIDLFVDANNMDPLSRILKTTEEVGDGIALPLLDDITDAHKTTPYSIGAYNY